MVYFHRLGTSQEEDILIHRDPENPEWMFGVEVSDCGKYLIISVSESCEPANRVFYIDLESAKLQKDSASFQIVKVIDSFEAEYSYITNEKTKFWFKTNLKAPNYKVISMTIEDGKEVERSDVIPHSETCLVNYVFCVDGDKLVASLLRDVKEELRLYDLNGQYLETALEPSVLAVNGVSGRKNQSEIFFKVGSFVIPGLIYRMDLKQSLKTKTPFLETQVNGLNSDEFVEKQVFVESKDGTKVPMFIVHRKNLVLNGQNPTLLCRYICHLLKSNTS
jgi:prolyl oligopeptidase